MLIIIGIFVGFILPFQTSINTKLSQSTNSPLIATFVSFVVGLIPLTILTAIMDGSLLFSPSLFSQFPWWTFTGGILGVIYILNSIFLFQKLGAAQAAILPILGQILTGLIIDHFGLFHSTVSPMTIAKLIGAIMVLIGVLGTVPKSTSKTKTNPIYQLFGISTGALSAIQTSINGQLGIALKSSYKAALFGFIIGSIILIIILLTKRPFPSKTYFKAQYNPFWMYLGGLIGATFVLGSVFIAPNIGTGLTIISSLIGISAGGLCLEHFGWFNTPVKPIHINQVLSVVLMLCGVLVIQFITF